MAGTANFDALKNLLSSANDLLHSPMIKQTLAHRKEEKLVNEVSESSLSMLELCGISKDDVLLLVKEHLQDLQSTLRRSVIGAPYEMGDKVAAYNRYRKNLKKETLKCLKYLKGMKGIKSIKPNVALADSDEQHSLIVVVDVLREVRLTTISVLESLLSLISIPWLDTKSVKWSLALKFMRASSPSLYDSCDIMELQIANNIRLAAVGIVLEDLEFELECMSRRLIETRVLLLNIFSTN